MAREAARRAACANNLKQIGLALYNYHQQYGSLPPAYVPGPDGKPWHSWRVLLLPFIEQTVLYAQYDFNEPWDGPNNLQLAAAIAQVYSCPAWNGYSNGYTSYFAVVGPKTAWPGPKSRRLDEITDDPGNTILVMEAGGLDVPWTEPRDVDFDAIAALTTPDPKIVGNVGHYREPPSFYIVEGRAINVLTADFTVHEISSTTPGKRLAPLLTSQGGEPADIDALRPELSDRLNWPRVLAVVMLVISTLLLWWSTRPRRASEE